MDSDFVVITPDPNALMLTKLVEFLNEDFDKIVFERKNGKGLIIGIRDDGTEVRSNVYKNQKVLYERWIATEKSLYDANCNRLTVILRDQ